MLTAGPRGQFPIWRRSRERLSVCSVLRCPDLWLQCSVSFVHGLEKTRHALTLPCNHRSGHLKTEHTESLFLLRRHLGNWPRSKHEKWTAGSAWETWNVAAADGVRCARVRWEINFLLTFETAPFFCVYPVLQYTSQSVWSALEMHQWCAGTSLSSVICKFCCEKQQYAEGYYSNTYIIKSYRCMLTSNSE